MMSSLGTDGDQAMPTSPVLDEWMSGTDAALAALQVWRDALNCWQGGTVTREAFARAAHIGVLIAPPRQ